MTNPKDSNRTYVQVSQEGKTYAVCMLQKDKQEFSTLDLFFSTRQGVSIKTEGGKNEVRKVERDRKCCALRFYACSEERSGCLERSGLLGPDASAEVTLSSTFKEGGEMGSMKPCICIYIDI